MMVCCSCRRFTFAAIDRFDLTETATSIFCLPSDGVSLMMFVVCAP